MARLRPTLAPILALLIAIAPLGPLRADPRDDARAIVEMTVTEDMFRGALAAQGPMLASAMENDLRRRGIQLTDTRRFAEILGEEMLTLFTLGMQDETVAVYLDLFTPGELADIRAFYETPSGQALLRRTPALMSEGARIGGTVGQRIGGQVSRRVADRLAREGIELTSPDAMQRLLDALRR